MSRKLTQEEKDYLSQFWKGKKKSKKHALNIKLAKLGQKNPMYGIKPSKETLLKRSKALKGKVAWNKGKKCPQLITNWRGGISKENHILRHSLEYRLWRIAVFERDNYTCIWCGQRGGKLNADHIKPFALFPELRFAIDNGRTLCENCHKTTDTYGVRKFNQYKVNTNLCMCIMDAKPFDFIPVTDVRNPYCLKCGKSILAMEEIYV